MTRRGLRWARNTLGWSAGAVLLALGVGSGWIAWTGGREDLRSADCIVVPGARVLEPGRPGPMLEARVVHAVELYRAGWSRAVILTGGAGESGPVESEEARRLAMSLGVPPGAIFTEAVSHDTRVNFQQARDIMRAHGWRSCLVCTDPFHIPRSVRMARDLGLEAWPAPVFRSPGHTQALTRLAYTLRECAGWVRYFLHGVIEL